jgi:hypothetical protein
MRMVKDGVFMNLVNRRAFLDRVVLGIRGRRKDSSGPAVQIIASTAIGGKGRKYARKQSGVVAKTGNSFDLVYGPMLLAAIVPPMMLTVRSDGAPITREEMTEVVNAICEPGQMSSISLVELTSDFVNLPIEFFDRSIFFSAHGLRQRAKGGRKTYYVGGRTSPSYVCIYQKTENVVRLEFVLRRPFLRRCGITQIADLEKLRSIDFSRRIWLRKVDAAALKSLQRKIQKTEEEDVRQRILLSWINDLPLRESIPAAKKYFGAVPDQLARISPVEKQLRRMQKKLVV